MSYELVSYDFSKYHYRKVEILTAEELKKRFPWYRLDRHTFKFRSKGILYFMYKAM